MDGRTAEKLVKGHYWRKEQTMVKTEETDHRMEHVKDSVCRLVRIVADLEKEFPGRHITLDGHPVGRIGEVMASYYYEIKLYENPVEPVHDGTAPDGRRVQIKMTQRIRIILQEQPDYLIVMRLFPDGTITEIYNGPGREPWQNARERKGYRSRSITSAALTALARKVPDDLRIEQKNTINKEYELLKGKERQPQNDCLF